MFGRGSDRSQEDQRRNVSQAAPTGTREAIAVPVTQQLAASAAAETVVAADDRIEGKIRTAKGARIMGTVDGSIESATHVHIAAGAKVTADVTAEEVVIGGTYSGKLVCRQRLEIQPTGRVSGSIETVKLMLHEGGYVDGELHMQKPPVQNAERRPADSPFRQPDPTARAAGSVRAAEPSIRQATGIGSASTAPSTE